MSLAQVACRFSRHAAPHAVARLIPAPGFSAVSAMLPSPGVGIPTVTRGFEVFLASPPRSVREFSCTTRTHLAGNAGKALAGSVTQNRAVRVVTKGRQ